MTPDRPTLYCNLCGSPLALIDPRHKRGWCPLHRRHVTAVTEEEWMKQSAKRVREALA